MGSAQVLIKHLHMYVLYYPELGFDIFADFAPHIPSLVHRAQAQELVCFLVVNFKNKNCD